MSLQGGVALGLELVLACAQVVSLSSVSRNKVIVMPFCFIQIALDLVSLVARAKTIGTTQNIKFLLLKCVAKSAFAMDKRPRHRQLK